MIGEKLKQLRKGKGYTLQQVADASKSSKSCIYAIEQGTQRPSAQKLSDIAKCLSVTVDYFLNDNDLDTEIDRCFYNTYLSFDEKTKEKIRAIVDCFNY